MTMTQKLAEDLARLINAHIRNDWEVPGTVDFIGRALSAIGTSSG